MSHFRSRILPRQGIDPDRRGFKTTALSAFGILLALGAALSAEEAKPKAAIVTGRVFSASGNPVGGATVKMSSAQATYVAITGSGADPGHYSIPGVPEGKYDFTVVYGVHTPQTRNGVIVGGDQQEVDFVLDATCAYCDSVAAGGGWSHLLSALQSSLLWTVVLCLVFVGNIWAVRWHNIARPNRELLQAEIDKVTARFKTETGLELKKDDARTCHLWTLLEAARAALSDKSTVADILFWSRGRELTAWSRIYELQRDSVNLYAAGSLPMLRARLQAIELDLLDIDKTHAKTLAGNVKGLRDQQGLVAAALSKALAETQVEEAGLLRKLIDQPGPGEAALKNALANAEAREAALRKEVTETLVQDEEALRALLVEVLTYLNDENDNSFGQLVGWQTKAVWLVGVGCTLIVVLAFAVGNPVLFIAGAAGGYLSRMARQLKRADVPTDYGASWTTLFLSPIMGALAGWFGILLIVVLADSKLAVLGAAFQQIEWYCPLAPLTLGLAFALGFSERLFDGIVSSLEDKVDKDREAATQPKQPIFSNTAPDPATAAASAGKATAVKAAADKAASDKAAADKAAADNVTAVKSDPEQADADKDPGAGS